MTKTYNDLLARLILHYTRITDSVKWLEGLQDINESEEKTLMERKAIAEDLKHIIEIEKGVTT